MLNKDNKDDLKAYIKEINIYMQKFRSLAERLPPAENALFEDELSSERVYICTHTIKFNLLDNIDTIKNHIDRACTQLKNDVEDKKSKQNFKPVPCKGYITNSNGKKLDKGKLFRLWDRCIAIYEIYMQNPTKDHIKNNMELIKSRSRYNFRNVSEVMLYVNHTKPLIAKANLDGKVFYAQAGIPFRKNRKPISKKKVVLNK